MGKPTVFFSHSSRDEKPLARLKELFVEKTGGSIDVFLSSDGQSIPLGRNWVHRVQEALSETELMVVFVSPSSMHSGWMFFEAGFAYSKDIRVVPVGFLGIDLNNVPPPLGLLQGFNITSEDGLNNLIALVNKVFGHSHQRTFTNEDFTGVSVAGERSLPAPFGDYTPLIREIQVLLKKEDGYQVGPEEEGERIAHILETEGIECSQHGGRVYASGVMFTPNRRSEQLEIQIEPCIADAALSAAQAVLRGVRVGGIHGVGIYVNLEEATDCLTGLHRVSGRLHGTGVRLVQDECLALGDMEFRVGRYEHFHQGDVETGPPFVWVRFLADPIPLHELCELVSLLFERGVLFPEY